MTSSLETPAVDAAATRRWDAELACTRLHFGAGRLEEVGALARASGARRALLVSDAGLRRAGHTEAAERSLRAAGIGVGTFEGIEPNPTTRHVEAGTAFARGGDYDFIVALGGGSAMDCAKGINFLLTNGGRMEDYWGVGKAKRPLLPALAVPTTAGTGSDAQSYALITQEETGRKMACGDRKARFRAVILDPRLVATAPREVAAAAAIDALSHAVETYVTRKRNPISAMLAAEAWHRIESSLEATLSGNPEPAAAGRLLLGAHLAGGAIEASMLGAAHACANPLTARHRIPHGEAVGLMLPAVVRFNAEVAGALYWELASGGGEAVATRIETLRRAAGLPERLGELGVERRHLPELALLAADEWTGGFNPRPVGVKEYEELYAAAM